jgi:hypothetical protein
VRFGKLRFRLRRTEQLVALQAVFWAHSAVAATATAPAGDDRVDLFVDGSQDDVRAFVEALREPLRQLGLTVYPLGVAERDDAGAQAGSQPRARVWIDARNARDIELVIALGSTNARPARRSVARGEPGPVVVEEVAYVVRATLESLFTEAQASADTSPDAGPVTALPPPPASPTAPTPGAEEDSPSQNVLPRRLANDGHGLGLDVAAFATGRGLANGVAVLGSGASVDLVLWGRQTLRPRLSVAASFDAPFESSGPVVNLRVSVWSVRAVPIVTLLRWGWLGLDAGIGGGVEGFNAFPTPSPGAAFSVTPLNVGTLVDPVVSGQVTLGFSPTGGASVLVGGYVDYDITPRRYVTSDGSGEPSAVLDPWRLRPAVLAGLCIPLAGTGACGRRDNGGL